MPTKELHSWVRVRAAVSGRSGEPHLVPQSVALLLADAKLLLPALHVGRGLSQRVLQPRVALLQRLELRLPLLGVGVAVVMRRGGA